MIVRPLRRRLRTVLERRLGAPSVPAALAHLERQGFRPAMVFDVGAYRGDFARDCLARWPDASIVCFEPQRRMAGALAAVAAAAAGRMHVFPVLVGASERDHVALHEAGTASSVLVETAGPQHPAAPYPMTTIDRTVAQHCAGRPPDLLKLDVQGYELEALKGAEGSLPGIGAIVTEINLLDLHEGVPLLAEVVAWLAARGFVAYDLGGLMRRPLDGALWQIDMIFVPVDSPLRRDKRWGVQEPHRQEPAPDAG